MVLIEDRRMDGRVSFFYVDIMIFLRDKEIHEWLKSAKWTRRVIDISEAYERYFKNMDWVLQTPKGDIELQRYDFIRVTLTSEKIFRDILAILTDDKRDFDSQGWIEPGMYGDIWITIIFKEDKFKRLVEKLPEWSGRERLEEVKKDG